MAGFSSFSWLNDIPVCVCVCVCVYVHTHLVAQSCLTLSPPGSSDHVILQARILEWAAISFSRWSSQPRNRTQVSCTAGRLFTNWASRLKLSYKGSSHIVHINIWVPFPSPGDLPDPGIGPGSPALYAGYLSSEPPGKYNHTSPASVQLLTWWVTGSKIGFLSWLLWIRRRCLFNVLFSLPLGEPLIYKRRAWGTCDIFPTWSP